MAFKKTGELKPCAAIGLREDINPSPTLDFANHKKYTHIFI